MLIITWGFIVMYTFGVMSFSLKRKHLLLMLLSLEFLVVSLYFGLYFYMSYYDNECYFMLVFPYYKGMWSCFSLVFVSSINAFFWDRFY